MKRLGKYVVLGAVQKVSQSASSPARFKIVLYLVCSPYSWKKKYCNRKIYQERNKCLTRIVFNKTKLKTHCSLHCRNTFKRRSWTNHKHGTILTLAHLVANWTAQWPPENTPLLALLFAKLNQNSPCISYGTLVNKEKFIIHWWTISTQHFCEDKDLYSIVRFQFVWHYRTYIQPH